MTQADIVERAKQGDAGAIATLLNQGFKKRGITAIVKLDQHCLMIELRSLQAINQLAAIAVIQQGMNHLKPAHIQTVLVSGQAEDGADNWMESFTLSQEANPATSTFSQVSHPPSPLNHQRSSKNLLSQRKPSPRSAASSKLLRPQQISTSGWGALLTGLILAIALFILSPLKLLFRGFLVLVHEVGHAITHWAFGRPAIPTVNIYFGGGVTITFGQIWLLNALIYLAIAYLVYRLRAYPRLQGVVAIATLLYTYCLLTRTNTLLSTFMGHGMELIAIVVCLFLATSGYFCRIKGDRTIYAMLGFFTCFSDTEFSWQLLHDSDFRYHYEDGIGGIIDNDFVILANEYFGVNLSAIAQAFLLACLAMPAIAFLMWRYQPWLLSASRQLLKS
ncbi:MAG: hypothetical protein IGS48_03835 [Oscillatoriales cyanobacterium C42_A2020_001]|nr:hypothetical protein [Leptolyngbyaceae cyanobacterium C42_A2020_001]